MGSTQSTWGVINSAALGTQVGNMNTSTVVILLALVIQAMALPLATQEDVEKEIASVADTEETEFAKEERDAKVTSNKHSLSV